MDFPGLILGLEREENSSRQKNPLSLPRATALKDTAPRLPRARVGVGGAAWRDNRPFTRGRVMGKARMGKERALHL